MVFHVASLPCGKKVQRSWAALYAVRNSIW